MKFAEWLLLPAQMERRGPIGDLAKAAREDPDWPKDGGLLEITEHLIAVGLPVSLLNEARACWRAER